MSDESKFSTQYFRIVNEPEDHVRDILIDVYMALVKKGYNPVNQMVGYIMSEDPTYITSYNNSRSKIVRINRDEIIEELVRSFVEYHQLDQKREERVRLIGLDYGSKTVGVAISDPSGILASPVETIWRPGRSKPKADGAKNPVSCEEYEVHTIILGFPKI